MILIQAAYILDWGLSSSSDEVILIHMGDAVMDSSAHYSVKRGLPDQHLSRSKYGTGFSED